MRGGSDFALDMVLEKLIIEKLGTVGYFSYDFDGGVNLIKTNGRDEIAFALRTVLNHKPPLAAACPIREGTRIAARAMIEGKRYLVVALPRGRGDKLSLKCFGEDGSDATAEYLRLTEHCLEQDDAESFSGEGESDSPRFLRYAEEKDAYAPRELSARTEGLSDIKAFRAYLRGFIKSFCPEDIREGKKYRIIMTGDGRYGISYGDANEVRVFLSASEKLMFKYLCFLRTAEFWCGFEQIRNMHGIKKPLLVGGLLERIDESIDLSRIIKRTASLDRQVIVITSRSEKRELEDLLKEN